MRRQWTTTPEKGAKLRVLRWSRFVQGDIDQYMKNVQKFQDKYGIEVRVDNEGWEDVRPKAAVAANIGSGSRHHPVDERRREPVSGQARRRHRRLHVSRQQVRRLLSGVRAIPEARRQEVDRRAARRARAMRIVYRDSMLKAAGFDAVPKDTDGFLKLCKALQGEGHARRLRARQRDRRRQHVVPLARLGARRQARRPEQQGRHRQPRDDEGARVREGALRDVRARHAVVARPEQQQGVPRRPDRR